MLPNSAAIAIEEVRRFDSAFDDVTHRSMAWPGFWCPHDAEFLNWRYLAHPTNQYVAFAAIERGELAGYAVMRLAPTAAWLMDFVAPVAPSPAAYALLRHALSLARAAGCERVDVVASPTWRHRPLLRRAGCIRRPSTISWFATGEFEPEVARLDDWQFVSGDSDTF